MFEQFFGLKFNPFTKEIPDKDLFMSQDLKELISRLKYLQNTRGIGLVVGEAGTGKSTALRQYASSLNPSLYKICYFALSTVTVKEFYHGLASMLGETPAYKKIALFQQIQRAILSYYFDQRITPVIMLDEIHMASNAVLEDLRLIFNFNIDSSNPFILILSGQPLIKTKLSLNINSPLRQRLAVKYTLQGLSKDELLEYIKTRLKIAGLTQDIFTPAALQAIYANTKGFPRLVNNLATTCLMFAASQNKMLIDEEIVYQAQNEITL